MASTTLNASIRSLVGKGAARKLRASKQVPGVSYGHHREPQPVAVDTRELERMLDKTAGETTVVELNLGGISAKALIRDIQRHPFRREVLHIDFQELVAGEKVEVEIPVILTGTSPGVRLFGGIVDQILRQIRVEIDPSTMPNHFE